MIVIRLQARGGRRGRRHHLFALTPDRDDNDDIAGRDQYSRDDEKGDGDECHVELPLPRDVEVDPTLRPVDLRLGRLVKVQNWGREEGGEEPGYDDQPARSPPRAREVHGVSDGVVAIDGQGDEDVGRGVGHQSLGKSDQFARDETGLPTYGDLPDDVGKDGD